MQAWLRPHRDTWQTAFPPENELCGGGALGGSPGAEEQDDSEGCT